jgi:hypothetical protein
MVERRGLIWLLEVRRRATEPEASVPRVINHRRVREILSDEGLLEWTVTTSSDMTLQIIHFDLLNALSVRVFVAASGEYSEHIS